LLRDPSRRSAISRRVGPGVWHGRDAVPPAARHSSAPGPGSGVLHSSTAPASSLALQSNPAMGATPAPVVLKPLEGNGPAPAAQGVDRLPCGRTGGRPRNWGVWAWSAAGTEDG